MRKNSFEFNCICFMGYEESDPTPLNFRFRADIKNNLSTCCFDRC